MKTIALTSCIVALAIPVACHAAPAVYPGCAVPALKNGHHTFYVDPVKGTPNGDGSAAKPWRTLGDILGPNTKVLSTQVHKKVGGTDPLVTLNPNGPIKAGDVIMLMSGNHGVVNMINAFNTDFITVMAAPGQTPVISRLGIVSASKWMFQGIKFQGVTTDPTPKSIGQRGATNLVGVWDGYLGASSQFVFANDSFSTADNTNGWSDTDLLLKPYNAGLQAAADCVSVTSSDFRYLLNGIGIIAPHVLVADNQISYFSGDGIDLTSGNVLIQRNQINHSTAPSISPWHPDAIQGWSKIVNGSPLLNDNVTIDSNVVVKMPTSNPSYMQGIDAFDGAWDHVTIQNNVVVSDTWHGISWSGAANLSVLNNTVYASNPTKATTWISIGTTHQNVPSKSIVVRNNIATTMTIPGTDIVYDHNFLGGNYSVNGVTVKKTDTAKQMVIIPELGSQFVQGNPTVGSLNLRLKNGSALSGAGSAVAAPGVDVTGAKRATPVSPGAYAQF